MRSQIMPTVTLTELFFQILLGRGAVRAFEHADEIAGLHAELLGDLLHGHSRLLLKELNRAAHAQLMNVLLWGDSIALNEQSMKMLYRISGCPSHIR